MSAFLKSIKAYYAIPKHYEFRTRKCKVCDIEFCDVTRGAVKCICSEECRAQNMRNSGLYDWTDERREKASVATRDNLAAGIVVNPFTLNSVKATIKQTNLTKYGVENWKQTPEGRALTVKTNSTRIVSLSTRRKHSAASRRVLKGRLKSRGKAGFRVDLNRSFRSSWEANYARYLNYRGVKWEFEPETFDLKSGKLYTPDFKINNFYVEVKGWMDHLSVEKIRDFTQEYPDKVLFIVGKSVYIDIQVRLGRNIPNWEGLK